ncbi:hypothetical protein [Corynebacterium cystitidis]|uniref:hypothetical protein n=1 Tax=Corynebacterium cystitidis TaxID=35757 RepID=UPI00211E6FDA|nr:hypothetical protein [Corynebacterium cystitidis]
MTSGFNPTTSRSYRQIQSYVYLFDKIERERIRLSSLPKIEQYIDRAVKVSHGTGWEYFGNALKDLIRRDDVEGLKEVLLTPDEDRYRSISPLLMLLMTPEEGQRFRPPPRVATPDMLTVD